MRIHAIEIASVTIVLTALAGTATIGEESNKAEGTVRAELEHTLPRSAGYSEGFLACVDTTYVWRKARANVYQHWAARTSAVPPLSSFFNRLEEGTLARAARSVVANCAYAYPRRYHI